MEIAAVVGGWDKAMHGFPRVLIQLDARTHKTLLKDVDYVAVMFPLPADWDSVRGTTVGTVEKWALEDALCLADDK